MGKERKKEKKEEKEKENKTKIEIELSKSTWLVIEKKKIAGEDYVDVRKYVSTPGYTGPTRKGVAIPAVLWDEFLEACRKIRV